MGAIQYKKLVTTIRKNPEAVYPILPKSDYIRRRLVEEARKVGLDVRPIESREADVFSDPIYTADYDVNLVREWEDYGGLIVWLEDDKQWDEVVGLGHTPYELANLSARAAEKELTARYEQFQVEVDPLVISHLSSSMPLDEAMMLLDRLTLEKDRVQITDLGNKPAEVDVFKLYDTLITHRVREAKKILRQVLSKSHPLEIAKTLATLNRRQMCACDALNRGYGTDDIAETLACPSWLARKMAAQCRQVPYDRLVAVQYVLAWIDKEIKMYFRDAEMSLRSGVMMILKG